MAKGYFEGEPAEIGKLSIKEVFPNCVEVILHPVTKSDIWGKEEIYPDHKILEINGQDNYIEFFPIHTSPSRYLKPKYPRLSSIILEGFDYKTPENVVELEELLLNLPEGFIKNYNYGLGLHKELKYIVDAASEFKHVKRLAISKSKGVVVEGETLYLSHNAFNKLRANLQRITTRAQRAASKVKTAVAFNPIAFHLDLPDYPQRPYYLHPDGLEGYIAEPRMKRAEAENARANALCNNIISQTKKLAAQKPELIVKLREDIELVALEELIRRFEDMLSLEGLTENNWKRLFKDNPFILTLAFGYPVVEIQDEATVGGVGFSGRGQKISDFLHKNAFTNNAALIEIKRPDTELLSRKEYRGGVFSPHKNLTDAVSQLLDQIYYFQKNATSLKDAERNWDIETFGVDGILVAGKLPTEYAEKKSFELLRKNLKNINIITFDELLAKLQSLHNLLDPSPF